MRFADIFRIVALVLALTFSTSGQEDAAPRTHSTTGEAARGAVSAEYTCPMHPAVRQIGPGKCPECQMDLVLSGGAESTSSTTAATGTTTTTSY